MARRGKENQYQKDDRSAAIRRRRELVMRMQDVKRNFYPEEAEEEEKAWKQRNIQAKLEINEPGDKHEQEADEVAGKVAGGESINGVSKVSSGIQKKHDDEGSLMAKGDDGELKGTAELQAKLDASKGGGQSLDDKTKSEMESKMGADLSDVKIHTGSNAHEMAEGINAKAFTHEQDIYFKNGNYNTNSSEGKELLAHELVHTQQQKDGVERKVQRQKEDEADIESARKKIAEYILHKNEIIVSFYELPLETIFAHVFIMITNEKEESSYYHLYLLPNGIKELKTIDEDTYLVNKEGHEGELMYAKNNSGSGIELYISHSNLEAVTITAFDTKRLDKLKEFAEKDEGFKGIFYNYPEEYAALLFVSLNPVEREKIVGDKALLKQLGSKLDNAQYARGLEKLNLTLDEKLSLLWEGRSSFSGREIKFEDLRGLLLASGEEGVKLHDRLAAVFNVTSELRIDFLMDEVLLDSYIKSQSQYPTSKKPGDLLYDDQLGSKEITLTPEETKLVNSIITGNKTLNILTATEKTIYLKAFKRNALKVTFDLLDLSEKEVMSTSDELLKGQADDILKELKVYKISFERMNYLNNVISSSGWGYDPKDTKQNKDFLRTTKAEAEAEKKQLEGNIRGALAAKFPIMNDTKIDLLDLYNSYGEDETSEDLEIYLEKHLGTVFENIQETRRIIRDDPDQVFKLEGVVKRTKELMGVPGSVFEEIVDEKVAEIMWNETLFSIGLAVLSIGLAIASFGSLSPLALSIIGASSFVVSGVDFYYTYENYNFETVTSGTSINSEDALSFKDPSVIWVVASFAGAVADLVSAIKAIKAAGLVDRMLVFARNGEGAEEIAAELEKLGVITKGLSQADIVNLLTKARAYKIAVKKQLLVLFEEKTVNLQEVDALADIYMAEKFNDLNKLDNVDDFIKKDLPAWYDTKLKSLQQLEEFSGFIKRLINKDIRAAIIDLPESKKVAELYFDRIKSNPGMYPDAYTRNLDNFDDWLKNVFKTDAFEAHHMIPKNVLNKSPYLQEILDWARKNGKAAEWDFGGIDNGIMLQKRKKVFGEVVGDHANHPNYDKQIEKIINQIYNNNLDDLPGAFEELKQFSVSLKSQLTENVVKGDKIVNDIVIKWP